MKFTAQVIWVHQRKGICLQIAVYALTNLFRILGRELDLGSLHILSREARKELQLFESRPKEAISYHMDPSLPLNSVIFPTQLSPTGIMAQEDKLWNGFNGFFFTP